MILKILVFLGIIGIAGAVGNNVVNQNYTNNSQGSVNSAAITIPCSFTTSGNIMKLNADCQTDVTILVPDGLTLDGNHHKITAIDPTGDHFKGAIVKNAGSSMNIKNLTLDTQGLANVCDAGDNRLRGILMEGAQGTINNNTILNINQGASGCQEGNAIEVRNAPFDLTGTADLAVEIDHNNIEHYQKTGIVANGDVNANIHHNKVGSADLPNNIAANSIQLGFGAIGKVDQNQIDGNQWCGPSDFAATAVLLFETGSSDVSKNIIGGNSDIGIYGLTNNTTIDNNKVTDSGVDCNANGYDIGIGDYDAYTGTPGDNNKVTNNKVSGFTVLYEEVLGGKNKTPGKGPQKGNPWF